MRQQHVITDAGLAADLRARAAGGSRLFRTTPEKVMAFLRRASGVPGMKNHDLRTWNATDLARQIVNNEEAPSTPEDYWLKRDAVAEVVARKLGDTRAVVLSNYIDPKVFENWQKSVKVVDAGTRPKISRKVAEARGPAAQLRRTDEEYGRLLRDTLKPEWPAAGSDGDGRRGLTQPDFGDLLRAAPAPQSDAVQT